MKKIYFNREKAIELQMTATTPEEANKRFDFSCSICNNAAWCNEAKCAVYHAHEAQLIILEGEKKEHASGRVITRKYTKTPAFDKGQVQKVLTKALKNITLRRQALAIDAASVYLKINDYANAEIVLRKNGLETEANAVGRLK